MAKGTIGKQNVVNKMKQAFGADWIGEYDKKYFVWTKENGERIQIAISLTCPKVQIEVADAPVAGDFDFEDDAPANLVAQASSESTPAQISDEERARINELMAKLGL
jgi:hypothetical protein